MLPTLRNSLLFPSLSDEFLGKNLLSDFFGKSIGFDIPAVNIAESGDAFEIEVAAPGLIKEDFKIDVHNNVLTISSEKEDKKEEEGKNYRRREFSYTAFERSFTLPDSVDADKITASHKDGILKINIPKKEEAKEKPSRQIKIS
ncbi:MAG TPA: Hsp20/alpha crystallin family protein [Bacteroidales bacterium]|jgi:HSP20 family protein|nr:Hsp20/alpha crystallin family protein [Bacteroidales bacterium]MDI9574489.1 Hsp20/alpha crystallin family protein [Bacteroidota bacterium]OQC57207.1 MAG: 18 kDa heat shock protein [Bacteroidetes bacterium ADurb.Bin012]MBP9589391.1 Hsp20/alpha crystallin family protein [Bacteroidales bacterium]HNQ60740.1 Hsp20/alpha crystallin family protein [Bacteroidales bacterium]